MTDQVVASTAATYADFRPPLDFISQQALVQDTLSGVIHTERDVPQPYLTAPVADDDGNDSDAPEVVLWATLVLAPPEGTTVPDLVAETGMSRPWVYLRLRELADQGQVIQVSRGRWRAATHDTE